MVFSIMLCLMLLVISSVGAADNQTTDFEDANYLLTINNGNDEDLINKENSHEVSNYDFDNLDDNETLMYCTHDEEILDSPAYYTYSVQVNDITKSYDESKSILMTMSPASVGYDFYLKIYDSKNVQKESKRFYSLDSYSKAVYNSDSKSLGPGIYTIKIINYADNHLMTSAKLTVKSVPYNYYSVNVVDTEIGYKTNDAIFIQVLADSSYYFKYDFYLKLYDSKNVERFSERFYSTTSPLNSVGCRLNSNNLEPGVYTIKVINNDDNHLMDTAKLTVSSIPYSAYSVSVPNTSLKYGIGGKIEISISPASSGYLKYDFYLKIFDSNNTEKVSIRHYGKENSNKATYDVKATKFDPGVYTVKIINTLDNHLMATNNLTIKSVPYSDYSVGISNINMDYGIGKSIVISISPSSSGYLKYDFYFKIYDSNNVEKVSQRYYNTAASEKETYYIASASLNPGIYTIKIINNDDGHVMKIATLNIDKTIIESSDLIGNCDKITQYKVHVAKNNEFKNGLKVTFNCNGNEYTNVTDSNGYAYLNIQLDAGNYSITTKCNGEVNKNNILIQSVYVDNKYKNMYIDSLSTYYDDNKNINYGWEGNFKGFLNIYKGSTLTKSINIDNSKNINTYFTYEKYSNSISTSLLKDAGTYTLKIVDVDGTIINQSSVIIKKIPTALHVNDLYGYKNTKESTYLFLYDKNNDKQCVNGKVTLKFNGNTYNVNMKNGLGKVTLKLPSISKKYWVTATFKGDEHYEPSSHKFLVDVGKYGSSIIVSAPSKVKPGAKTIIKASVYYKDGTKKLTSGIIKFKINGKTYKSNIKKGVAKLIIKAPKNPKTYTFKASYSGTKDIDADSTTFKMTVELSFTVVVPTKLNKKINRYYGKYKVQTYKWIDYDSDGRHAHLVVKLYKNGKKLTYYKAKYYVHYSFGGGTWLYTNNHGETGYKTTDVGYNRVLKADWVKVKLWVWS